MSPKGQKVKGTRSKGHDVEWQRDMSWNGRVSYFRTREGHEHEPTVEEGKGHVT